MKPYRDDQGGRFNGWVGYLPGWIIRALVVILFVPSWFILGSCDMVRLFVGLCVEARELWRRAGTLRKDRA